MIIRIGSFGKRHNSTKQPAATWGTELSDVELKEDCSMEEPVFRIGFANWNSGYNYIYVPSWGRYYFVVDVTVRIGRIWEVSCRLDAAGTYRSDIRGSTGLIVYAQKANSEIIDNRIPTKTTATFSQSSAPFAPGLLTATGKIALTVVGNDSTQTFIITDAQLQEIIKKTKITNVFEGSEVYQPADNEYASTIVLPDGTDLQAYIKIGEWLKTLFTGARQTAKITFTGSNPLDCIRSAIWYPWDIVGDGQPQEIYLGALLDTDVIASPVVNKIRGGTVTVDIPWQATDWRRNAPYHQIYLYIPFVGVTQLSVSDLIGKTSLTVGWALNKLTGELNIQVMTDYGEEGAGKVIGVYSANSAVSIPVGASNITPQSALNSIITGAGAIAGAVSGNLLGSAALAAQSISSITPQISCIGGASGGAAIGLDMNVVCFSVFHDTIVTPSTIRTSIGEPYYKVATLNTITGFAQTERMSVSGLHMSDAVRQEINNMCDNGIFIE